MGDIPVMGTCWSRLRAHYGATIRMRARITLIAAAQRIVDCDCARSKRHPRSNTFTALYVRSFTDARGEPMEQKAAIPRQPWCSVR